MKQIIEQTLAAIAEAGNLRSTPVCDAPAGIDFTSNDYLGIAQRNELREEFLGTIDLSQALLSASASRLLCGHNGAFTRFEKTLSDAYRGRSALLFNSGYHANTGLISAFAGTSAYIIADRLVHASIIDGIKLSGLPFTRFRHNDYAHLDALCSRAEQDGRKPFIVAESIYSMDGDSADIEALSDVKRRHPGAMLYVDEAHAVGVVGNGGLGLSASSPAFQDVDIVVGTLGKALASAGAYAITSPQIRNFAVNRARSLIFSTATPPLQVLWSDFIFRRAIGMDTERAHLHELATQLAEGLFQLGMPSIPSHIQALIVGTPTKAVTLSQKLANEGLAVLPIRTPTVPPGTERLRISLSAALRREDVNHLLTKLKEFIPNE